jgi:hypothetical protein
MQQEEMVLALIHVLELQIQVMEILVGDNQEPVVQAVRESLS